MEQKQAELVKDFPSAFSKRKIAVNEPITPRENLLRLLRGEKPVWMPCSLDIQAVDPWCVPDNVARGLYSTDHRIPDEEKGGRDMFGQEWVYVPTAMGSMVRQGEELFEDVEEWPDKVRFPDVDAWDWAGAKAMLEPYIDDERLHESTIFTGFFERLIAFMGMENALLAMIDEDEQEFIHALFARLCDTYEQIIVHLQEQFHTDMIQLHDDWGNQLAPFFRMDTMETLIAPYIKRIVSFCHDRGLRFHLHSCGMNDQNVPLMIECGVTPPASPSPPGRWCRRSPPRRRRTPGQRRWWSTTPPWARCSCSAIPSTWASAPPTPTTRPFTATARPTMPPSDPPRKKEQPVKEFVP